GLSFRFERIVQAWQIFRQQLIEVLGNVVQFPAQRRDVSDLVIARLAFEAEERAVKLIGVLAQAFFAGNRAAFFGRDDFFANRFDLVIETGDVLFERVIFGQRG